MMFSKGLEGVVAAHTAISHVDGNKGKLLYRGYDAGELARTKSFEEVAYLLLNGELPSNQQLETFTFELVKKRKLLSALDNVITSLPKELEIMDVLRTCISCLNPQTNWPPTKEEAIHLIALFPTIIAAWIRYENGEKPIKPDQTLGHVENYLYMINGEIPTNAHSSALTAYLILTMEHGMNASTFAARVVSSTESDLPSAICGALGAMKGPLHGGAPTGVLQLLDDVTSHAEGPEKLLRQKLERGEKLMGFGHRVYKTTDPRASALRDVLSSSGGEDHTLSKAVEVEKTATLLLAEYKPGRALHVNVEYYAATVMDALSFKSEWFTPTFCVSRVVGWCAHVLEQAEDNRIFRPDQEYIGVRER
ncbi:citrate synthase/methylcitrate synthase [Alkalicoccobacillus porphyridii]|uniref:Citrate synthase n=2 Tax=Alkalicoccobacillus porphyridii TaxID=2597270 RepID=A0A554A1J2_9BACI|nr:citrate synthase/methylcitrate synthase [Alkalicoccobacillus porphyridii]